jgi:hypothetical protein
VGSYNSFADLRTAVLDRAGEDPTDPAGDYYAATERELVRVAYDVYNAHPYLFLRKNPPGALVTVAPYTTGTLAVTNGSTAITFGTPPGVGLGSFAGRKLVVTGWPEFYRIATHAAGAGPATLDVAYQGPDAAAAAFTAYKDEYDLATDVRHIVGVYVAETGAEIEQKSEEYLREEYPEPSAAAWPPQYFARIGESKIRFSQYPSLARRLEYPYTIVGDDIDTGTIYVPRQSRMVIADGALYFILAMKHDSDATAAGALFGQEKEALILDDLRKRAALAGPRHPASGPYR